jgi:transposase
VLFRLRQQREGADPVRASTLFRTLLAVTSLFVSAVSFAAKGLVINVRPSWLHPRCGLCGCLAPGYDQRQTRFWTAQPYGGHRLLLAYAPRRVDCPHCGVTTEAVPWARHDSRFTRDFEELVAYLAVSTDKTTVTRLMGISWRTVGSIIDRVVADHLDATRFDGLRRIGVDEFSYRKNHHYLTVVVDHDRRAIIWAAKGRGADTLGVFFNRLGKARSAAIKTVTLDMAGGYIKALRKRVPQAELVFDRFHVQRLASDALDEVRRAQWREQKDTEDGHAIKGCRYALLKNPWNLTQTERTKLREVQRTNMPLYRAYLLKETLAKALDYRQPRRARRALDAWLVWASHCHLPSFVKVAKTIRAHKEGILAYIRERMTNGVVEGINTRLRSITRRAFGFHSAQPLISMMYLCCGGIQLAPRLP